jgi:hypothetical protein
MSKSQQDRLEKLLESGDQSAYEAALEDMRTRRSKRKAKEVPDVEDVEYLLDLMDE